MSVNPMDVPPPQPRRRVIQQVTHRLTASAAFRARTLPVPRAIARRRLLITVSKWLLPLCALALLTTIVLWPEFDRATEKARIAMHRVSAEVNGGQLVDARYKGLDMKGRPYTVTAAIARQVSQEQIDLTDPNGDVTLENGTWLTLSSKQGTYMQDTSQLDLWQDVVLYRDDGTTMTTASASIDLKNGAAAGSEPVHVEGPWGVLDAKGFTVLDKGSTVQFTGPARVTMNGAQP